MRTIIEFAKSVKDFIIKTLIVYVAYFGLKYFYDVDFGFEWILYLLLIGFAQTITIKSAINKHTRNVLKRFKNSEALHIGDEFIFPLENDDKHVNTLLRVIDKDCSYIYAVDKQNNEFKLKNELIDAKTNMKIYINE